MSFRPVALLALLFFACTNVNTARLPVARDARDVFVTSGDLHQPYESVGPVQATRKGALAFGFFDPAGTSLDEGLADLVLEARAMGAEGIINVHYEQTQYLPFTRVLFAILFFIPLPSEVTLTGEAVKLKRGAIPPGGI